MGENTVAPLVTAKCGEQDEIEEERSVSLLCEVFDLMVIPT